MGLIKITLAAIGTLAIAVVSRILADETKAWLPSLTSALLAKAVARVPAGIRDRMKEEWRADLEETPGLLGPLIKAISLNTAAQKILAEYSREQASRPHKLPLAETAQMKKSFDPLAVIFIYGIPAYSTYCLLFVKLQSWEFHQIISMSGGSMIMAVLYPFVIWWRIRERRRRRLL